MSLSISEPFENKNAVLCDYGCDQLANFIIGRKQRPCCSKTYSQCSALTKKHAAKMTGSSNPIFGKKHNEEVRQKMRENHADFRGEKSGKWGKKYPMSEQTKEKIRRSLIGHQRRPKGTYKHSMETMEKILNAMAQRSVRSLMGWFRDYRFKSSYEMFYLMQHYDEVLPNENISRDEDPYKVVIPYEGGIYIPDYRFRDGFGLIEIKPERLLNHPKMILKHAAARRYCEVVGLRFVVVSEIDLKFDYEHSDRLIAEGIIRIDDVGKYERSKRHNRAYI